MKLYRDVVDAFRKLPVSPVSDEDMVTNIR